MIRHDYCMERGGSQFYHEENGTAVHRNGAKATDFVSVDGKRLYCIGSVGTRQAKLTQERKDGRVVLENATLMDFSYLRFGKGRYQVWVQAPVKEQFDILDKNRAYAHDPRKEHLIKSWKETGFLVTPKKGNLSIVTGPGFLEGRLLSEAIYISRIPIETYGARTHSGSIVLTETDLVHYMPPHPRFAQTERTHVGVEVKNRASGQLIHNFSALELPTETMEMGLGFRTTTPVPLLPESPEIELHTEDLIELPDTEPMPTGLDQLVVSEYFVEMTTSGLEPVSFGDASDTQYVSSMWETGLVPPQIFELFAQDNERRMVDEPSTTQVPPTELYTSTTGTEKMPIGIPVPAAISDAYMAIAEANRAAQGTPRLGIPIGDLGVDEERFCQAADAQRERLGGTPRHTKVGLE